MTIAMTSGFYFVAVGDTPAGVFGSWGKRRKQKSQPESADNGSRCLNEVFRLLDDSRNRGGPSHTPFLCREEGPSQPPSGKITTPTATALMSRRTFPNPVSSSYGGAVSKYVAGAPYRLAANATALLQTPNLSRDAWGSGKSFLRPRTDELICS